MDKVNGTTQQGLDKARLNILKEGLKKRDISYKFIDDSTIELGHYRYSIKKSWLSALSQEEYEDLHPIEKRNAMLEKARKLGFRPPADITKVSNRSLQTFIRFRTKLVLEVELAPMVSDDKSLHKELQKHVYLSEIILKESLFKLFPKKE